MEAALYHPQFGYYTTHADAMTRGGDYVTSPELNPVFGSLVAKQIIELWRAVDEPRAFDIVELGGGGGLLARDIIQRATRERTFAAALRYRIVELSPALSARQRRTLADVARRRTSTGAMRSRRHRRLRAVERILRRAAGAPRAARRRRTARGVRSHDAGGRFVDVLGRRLRRRRSQRISIRWVSAGRRLLWPR